MSKIKKLGYIMLAGATVCMSGLYISERRRNTDLEIANKHLNENVHSLMIKNELLRHDKLMNG